MRRFILLAFIMLVLRTEPALACICSGKPRVAEALRHASAVFLGKVVSSEYQKGAKYPDGRDAGEELTMRFRVERWWRGGLTPEVVLFTEQYLAPNFTISVSTCAYQFEVGKRYIVYAGHPFSDGKLRAVSCSRTSEVEKAGEELRALGKWRKPRSVRQRVPQRAKPNNGMHPTGVGVDAIRQVEGLRRCLPAGDAGR